MEVSCLFEIFSFSNF